MAILNLQTCLNGFIDNTQTPFLNFIGSELKQKVSAISNYNQVYHFLIELNSISSSLSTDLSTYANNNGATSQPCENAGVEIGYYIANSAKMVEIDLGTLASSAGTLSQLNTYAQSSLVVAINELQASLRSTTDTSTPPNLSTLRTVAKTSLLNAINELHGALSDTSGTTPALTTLRTGSQASLISAINELQGSLSSTAGTPPALSTLTTTVKTSLLAGINELQGSLSSTAGTPPALSTLTTTVKTSLVAAINELNVNKFDYSMGLCANTASLRSFLSGTTVELSSLATALAADLNNLFTIDADLLGGDDTTNPPSTAAECMPRLQCVMKPGTNTLCPAASTAPDATSAGCSGYTTFTSTCDKTWFCNLNKLRLKVGTLVSDDDGDIFSIYAAKEICPAWE